MKLAIPFASLAHGFHDHGARSNGQQSQRGRFGNRNRLLVRFRPSGRAAPLTICRGTATAAAASTWLRLDGHRACEDDQNAGKHEGQWADVRDCFGRGHGFETEANAGPLAGAVTNRLSRGVLRLKPNWLDHSKDFCRLRQRLRHPGLRTGKVVRVEQPHLRFWAGADESLAESRLQASARER